MSVAGVWNITIATPIGTQSVVLDLTEGGGVVAGVATSGTAKAGRLPASKVTGRRMAGAVSP